MNPAVAVIGAGNVGCALAADLVLGGFDVRLFTRSAERRRAIREAGGITLTGAREGHAPVKVVDEFARAVAGAGVVSLAVPTYALAEYAPPLVAETTDDQLIWLNPGHGGGALFLAGEFFRRAPARNPCIGQLSTSSHGARLASPAAVRVLGLPRAALASFPGRRLEECFARLNSLLLGRLERVGSVLEADLGNLNTVLHPAGMVCNAGWIEATGGAFLFYHQGFGPAVARVIEAVDRERMALAERLGVPATPILEHLARAGYTDPGASSVHEALRTSEALQTVAAPGSLNHRYLHEDAGWGLGCWLALARTAGLAAAMPPSPISPEFSAASTTAPEGPPSIVSESPASPPATSPRTCTVAPVDPVCTRVPAAAPGPARSPAGRGAPGPGSRPRTGSFNICP